MSRNQSFWGKKVTKEEDVKRRRRKCNRRSLLPSFRSPSAKLSPNRHFGRMNVFSYDAFSFLLLSAANVNVLVTQGFWTSWKKYHNISTVIIRYCEPYENRIIGIWLHSGPDKSENVWNPWPALWIPEAIALIDMGWPTVIAVEEGRTLHINPSENAKKKEEDKKRNEGVHLRLTLMCLPSAELPVAKEPKHWQNMKMERN